MISVILKSVIGALTGNLLDKVEGIFDSYFKKEISKEELRTKLSEALLKSATEIEVSHSETLAKTYDSFMKAMEKSPLIQRVWAATAVSQLVVLVWHQMGIPLLCFFIGNKACFPSSGSTVEWAYLLLGGLLGMAPLVLRGGPGKMNYDQLKSLAERK
jgi:hypothetical protein